MHLIKKYPVFLVYILLAVIHLILLGIGSELALYSKLSITISLGIIALLYFHKNNVGVSIALIAALIFSGCGDYALTKPGFAYFLAGIGFFLIVHICYLICFYFLTKNKKNNIVTNRAVLGGVALLTLAYIGYLVPGFVGPKLKLPITIYAFILLWMFLKAYKVQNYFSQDSVKLIGIGAIFFLLSDGLFSFKEWVHREDSIMLPLAIMFTYIVAQGLISLGLATLHKYETVE